MGHAYKDICLKCGAKRIDRQIGIEKTPEEYVAKMVAVFREVKRVLKKEGTLWLNLGDSYASQGKEGGDIDKDSGMDIERGRGRLNRHQVIKPKDLVGIPWRVAFALQADGWFLRQDIIWHKPNPMPESVTDRCTKAHEYVFLLAKSQHYFFDNEAIKEPAIHNEDTRAGYGRLHYRGKREGKSGTGQENFVQIVDNRNRRSVWTITTKPFREAHFATFPEDLVEPMVKAGTSEKGVCPDCGKAWERIIEPTEEYAKILESIKGLPSGNLTEGYANYKSKTQSRCSAEYITFGWQPTCKCNQLPVPAVVLDPFIGSGTTAVVAKRLGRNYIGIELNPKYARMAEVSLASMREPELMLTMMDVENGKQKTLEVKSTLPPS